MCTSTSFTFGVATLPSTSDNPLSTTSHEPTSCNPSKDHFDMQTSALFQGKGSEFFMFMYLTFNVCKTDTTLIRFLFFFYMGFLLCLSPFLAWFCIAQKWHTGMNRLCHNRTDHKQANYCPMPRCGCISKVKKEWWGGGGGGSRVGDWRATPTTLSGFLPLMNLIAWAQDWRASHTHPEY